MVATLTNYVDCREGGYWITDTRVSLESVVYAFKNGIYPEEIFRMFDSLTLEQVYGAIAFYLANKSIIDNYLLEGDSLYAQQRESTLQDNPVLQAKLNQARRVMV